MNEYVVIVLVCLLAGLGAGLGTGFCGLSAASVITPILVGFLGIPAYQAIGIALCSDVLASATSAIQYKKNDNIDLKPNALVMMAIIISFTVLGSFVSDWFNSMLPNELGDGILSNMTMWFMIFLGFRFIIKPTKKTKADMANVSRKRAWIGSVLGGIYIGFVCGFMGAGGGLMMLFVLTTILGYELKTAVGTSVFVMTFTALTGALTHFFIGGIPEYHGILILVLCIVFTLSFANIAAIVANKVDNKKLNRFTGIVLAACGIASVLMYYLA